LTGSQEFERITEEISGLIGYPFTVFQPYACNIRLQLVHRQEWRPLGVQRGEVVRTIPLGPKQTEKISTKIIRRKKVTRTSESLKAVEATTETTDTTKDSSEIIKESAETFGWNIEASASASWGFGSATVSGGANSETEEKSRATNNHLSEKVQKTASKIRKETKVVVSTESEFTFEITTASEIQNPNDEIPITFIYSKLQQQFEVLTQLAEINSVIFVAEEVSFPNQITPQWMREHDWIISKVLLDDSFRDTLISIGQETYMDSIPQTVLSRIGARA